jgi:small redox-active disulfide protein 2
MNDITQIRVGKFKIGIDGLKNALAKMEENSSNLSDEQIGNLLLDELSRHNYIGSDLKEEYAAAFLREYKKHIGQPVAEEAGDGLQIKVLGPGCALCEKLEKEVMAVLSENGIMADLEHVRDVAEIGTYGVMGMPALLINGEVKATGSVPSRTKLKAWIEAASK